MNSASRSPNPLRLLVSLLVRCAACLQVVDDGAHNRFDILTGIWNVPMCLTSIFWATGNHDYTRTFK
jgi:hypothetical protein